MRQPPIHHAVVRVTVAVPVAGERDGGEDGQVDEQQAEQEQVRATVGKQGAQVASTYPA